MRLLLLSTLFTVCAFILEAQSDDRLFQFNDQRIKKQKTAMIILGSWAIGNIAVGGILRGQHQGVERSFHEMNIGWNVVNLGIATFGLISASKTDISALGLYESIQDHHGFQKTLLFNAGLDIGYMLGGAYLIERSKNVSKNSARLEGFGKSIILQGGFLFAFDLVNYFILSNTNADIQPLLGMDITGASQIGFAWRF